MQSQEAGKINRKKKTQLLFIGIGTIHTGVTPGNTPTGLMDTEAKERGKLWLFIHIKTLRANQEIRHSWEERRHGFTDSALSQGR